MIDLRPYGKLHTILMLKDVVRRWWGVELAFADARGYCLDHAEGKIIPPANEFCRASLFSKEGFRRCNESIKAVRDELRVGTTSSTSATSGSTSSRRPSSSRVSWRGSCSWAEPSRPSSRR
jgi:hypothetical protein